MLTTTVKISNVTNLSDARYCAGMGVDMLGFAIDSESEQHVPAKKFNEIRSWIAGVQLVAESRDADAVALLSKLKDYEVDAIQVEDPGLLTYLRTETSLALLLRVAIDKYEASDLEALVNRYGTEADFLILESDSTGLLTPEWISVLKKIGPEYPILLGFGFDSEVAELLQELPIRGISLRGSEEIRPGFKDFGSLMDILETLEED